jgi:MOSC domain-containing protein YiiM
MRLLSLQTGMPKTMGDGVSANKMFGRWSTGIFKEPVLGPVYVRTLNLDGDGQADLTVHGGVDKAVYAYPSAHYPDWRNELGFDEAGFPFGALGENFTVEDANENEVCIGDIHQIGTARLQVSQPRQPCWKLARKWNMPDLPARLVRSGRSGWYYRVLQEGIVQAGEAIMLVERPFPEWTITTANQLAYGARLDAERAIRFAECPLLAPEWRNGILYRLGKI